MPTRGAEQKSQWNDQGTGESVRCEEGEVPLLCSKAAWMLRKYGTLCINVSESEHQETKNY